MSSEDFKLVAVGDESSCAPGLLYAYSNVKNSNDSSYVPTSFDNKTIKTKYNNTDVNLLLTCPTIVGEDTFSKTRKLSYPGASVFLICFSVVDPHSFDSALGLWAPEIRQYNDRVPIVLVGTQSELRSDPQIQKALKERNLKPVSQEDAVKLKLEIGAVEYVECSLITREGVDFVFQRAIAVCLEEVKKERSARLRKRRTFVHKLFIKEKWTIVEPKYTYGDEYIKASEHYNQLAEADLFVKKKNIEKAYQIYDAVLKDRPCKFAKRESILSLSKIKENLKKQNLTETLKSIADNIDEILKENARYLPQQAMTPMATAIKEIEKEKNIQKNMEDELTDNSYENVISEYSTTPTPSKPSEMFGREQTGKTLKPPVPMLNLGKLGHTRKPSFVDSDFGTFVDEEDDKLGEMVEEVIRDKETFEKIVPAPLKKDFLDYAQQRTARKMTQLRMQTARKSSFLLSARGTPRGTPRRSNAQEPVQKRKNSFAEIKNSPKQSQPSPQKSPTPQNQDLSKDSVKDDETSSSTDEKDLVQEIKDLKDLVAKQQSLIETLMKQQMLLQEQQEMMNLKIEQLFRRNDMMNSNIM